MTHGSNTTLGAVTLVSPIRPEAEGKEHERPRPGASEAAEPLGVVSRGLARRAVESREKH